MTTEHGDMAQQRTDGAAGLRGKLAAFAREESGMAAVEFAMVALPYLIVILGIMELAFGYFLDRLVQDAVMDARRAVRVGQIKAGATESDFRNIICDTGAVKVLLDCSRFQIDLREVADFDGSRPEFDEDADEEEKAKFEPGNAGTTNVLRVYYKMPRVFRFAPTAGQQTREGDLLLSGQTAFVIEP